MAQSRAGAAKPITKDGLVDALKIGGLSPVELIAKIEERGVDFRLTYDVQQDLKGAGATEALLDAVRASFRSKALSDSDKSAAASLLNSGRTLYGERKGKDALPVVTQALTLDPNSLDGFLLRASVYLSLGQAPQAECDVAIARQIAPANPDVTRVENSLRDTQTRAAMPGGLDLNLPAEGHQGFLGLSFHKRGSDTVVIGVLPLGGASRAGLQVGDILLTANGEPMEQFNNEVFKPHKLNPGDKVHFAIKRAGKSLTLEAIATPSPNTVDEALRYFGVIIKQFPADPYAYHLRGAAYLQVHNYQAALADAEMCVKLDADNPSCYLLRGQVKKAMGDAEGAKADETKAQSINQAESGAQPPAANPSKSK